MSSDLDDRKRAAVTLLLEGLTNAAVAERLDVHRSTLTRWRREPEVAQALAEGQRDACEAAGIRLRSHVHQAVDVIADVLQDRNPEGGAAVARVRLSAALEVLDRSGLGAGLREALAAPSSPGNAQRRIGQLFALKSPEPGTAK